MADWFKTDDGRFINLDLVTMTVPLEERVGGKLGGEEVYPHGERPFFIWEKDGAARLRRHLDGAAHVDPDLGGGCVSVCMNDTWLERLQTLANTRHGLMSDYLHSLITLAWQEYSDGAAGVLPDQVVIDGEEVEREAASIMAESDILAQKALAALDCGEEPSLTDHWTDETAADAARYFAEETD